MTDAASAVAEPARSDIVRVYVWEVPVRVTHWLIAISIVVQSVTGFYIGYPFITAPGPGQQAVMGTMRMIHGWTAYVFICAVLVRVLWMFTGNKYANWDKFIPVHRPRYRGMWASLRFYLFVLRRPPGFVGHNPLAGVTYTLVFALYFLAILTGLTLRGGSADVESPVRWFAAWAPLFGGFQSARWIHHAVMWLLLGFAVHHVYSGVLTSTLERNGTMESIFSGYKFVPPEDLEYSGYRFIDRHGQVDE
jgi:Ni/Fe-hydrogenase 1 B-type cytochrome subunit